MPLIVVATNIVQSPESSSACYPSHATNCVALQAAMRLRRLFLLHHGPPQRFDRCMPGHSIPRRGAQFCSWGRFTIMLAKDRRTRTVPPVRLVRCTRSYHSRRGNHMLRVRFFKRRCHACKSSRLQASASTMRTKAHRPRRARRGRPGHSHRTELGGRFATAIAFPSSGARPGALSRTHTRKLPCPSVALPCLWCRRQQTPTSCRGNPLPLPAHSVVHLLQTEASALSSTSSCSLPSDGDFDEMTRQQGPPAKIVIQQTWARSLPRAPSHLPSPPHPLHSPTSSLPNVPLP